MIHMKSQDVFLQKIKEMKIKEKIEILESRLGALRFNV